jgi:hypothetical protein
VPSVPLLGFGPVGDGVDGQEQAVLERPRAGDAELLDFLRLRREPERAIVGATENTTAGRE